MLRSERNWLEKKLDVLGEPDMNEVLEDKAKFSLFGLAFALLILISGSIPPIAALFLLLSGVFYVDVRIHSRDQDRTKAVDRQLPDAVDVLVLAVDSGMNFQHALALLTEANQGPIIDDLARVLRSIDLGDSRATAFSKMRDRSTSVTVRQFVNALIQAESMGVSLAPMLREQGNLLRKLQRERAREQAQKIPVKILFPVMLCFVPALLLFVLGPVALSFL